MKRCSKLYANGGLQIKTTTRFHYAPKRMDKSKILTKPNASENEEMGTLIANRNAKWHSPFGRQSGSIQNSFTDIIKTHLSK